MRIGTVRRPPRGVRKNRHAIEKWFDVWLPTLAPSAALLRHSYAWETFAKRYSAGLKRPEQSRLLDVLVALSSQAKFSVGCYCADESNCHRSVLRRVLRERGARVT